MTLLTTPQLVTAYRTLTKAHALGFRIVVMPGTFLQHEINTAAVAEILVNALQQEDKLIVDFSMTSNDTTVVRSAPISDLWDNADDLYAGFVRVANFFLSN